MSRTVFGVFLAGLGVCLAAARHCAADSLYLSAPTAHDILRVSENLGVSVFAQGYATPKQLIFNPHDTKVYVADAGQNFVQAITLTGAYSNFATGLSGPDGLAVDSAGNLFVSNPGTGSRANTISKITSKGAISTFVSGLTGPGGMAFDSHGNLYVTQSNATVAMVTPGGTVSTFATVLGTPVGITIDGADNLFVTEGPRVTRITPGGASSTFATGFTATPQMLTFDSQGILFVTTGNGIDRVSAAGVVTKKYLTNYGSATGIVAIVDTLSWTGGEGTWGTAAQWNLSQVPNATYIHVNVDNGNAASSAVTLDQNATVATLDVDAGDALSIAPGRTLTFVGTGTSTFDGALNNAGTMALTGTSTTGPRVKLLGGGTHSGIFAVNGSTLLTFGGGIHTMNAGSAFSGNGFITISGGSSVNFAAPLTVSGGLSLTVGGATLNAPSIHLTGNAKLDVLGGTIGRSDLTIDGGGQMHLYPGYNYVLVTTALAITNGKLDLGDNRLVVRQGDAGAVGAMIRAGGITTSASANGLTLAAGLASQAGTFGGVDVSAGDVLVGRTIVGDVDMDGRVDFVDLARLAQSYNTTGKFWYQGDFNSDGNVDFLDLAQLAQNYNTGMSSAAVPGAPAEFQVDVARAFANVPEPSLIGLVGLSALVACGRRRKPQNCS
jgi:sugar lactone lactonase YvrE